MMRLPLNGYVWGSLTKQHNILTFNSDAFFRVKSIKSSWLWSRKKQVKPGCVYHSICRHRIVRKKYSRNGWCLWPLLIWQVSIKQRDRPKLYPRYLLQPLFFAADLHASNNKSPREGEKNPVLTAFAASKLRTTNVKSVSVSSYRGPAACWRGSSEVNEEV